MALDSLVVGFQVVEVHLGKGDNMYKFNELPYERPDLKSFTEKLNNCISDFEKSENFEMALDSYNKFSDLMTEFITLSQIVYVRNSINTKDEFYEKEREFFDENSPYITEISNKMDHLLLNSKFKDEFVKKFGTHLFNLIECSIKSFSKDIIELLQEENSLIAEYSKLISGAKILFDGKELNLSGMSPYVNSKDRKIRKEANIKIAEFFKNNMENFDTLYDKLVKNRDKQAKTLGFENFVELGYYRMNRTDYTKDDVKNYRDQVLENIVPLTLKFNEKKRKRLNLDKLYIYDSSINFLDGNATPKGDREWQVERAKEMYKELSPETDKFFTMMTDLELLDLDTKPNKDAGGYCTTFDKYKLPFIFANFNGTAHDVEVLTHEAGHAFQVYQSMQTVNNSSYYWPTYEAAEIHSMSMEFITWPYMNKFFLEDTEKFKFSHLEGSVSFIPYGVTVDEFQHYVYENPEATPLERRMKWLEIEKKYKPEHDYDDIDMYKEGIFWFKQGHIFNTPFYYIDYTLAQVCAFQFLISSLEDPKKTWEKYVNLCKLGGSQPFTKLLESAQLLNPFKDNTLKNIVDKITNILDNFDDSKL